MAHADIAGLILAGGRSSRMGGGDKGLLALGSQPMLGHVIGRLAPQVCALAINANGDPARFAATGLPIVADTIGGFAGPLAGVLAGLRWAERLLSRPRAVVTVSCDAPFIPTDLVAALAAAAAGRPGAIALARSRGELHPVIGLWPLAHADDLEAALAGGVRKVLTWTDRHGTLPVDFADVLGGGRPVDPFFNANTPEELAEARGLMASARTPVIGIAGWKNSGKTTLATRLVAELVRRGFRIATVKHAHHNFDVDPGETDSARHRRAGAHQVAVVSSRRWALMTEAGNSAEPALDEILARLDPANLVIVEGYKRSAIPKIEVRRAAQLTHDPLADNDPQVIAIAADHAVEARGLPTFGLDDIAAIADLIVTRLSPKRDQP